MLETARIGAYAVSSDQTIVFWNRSAQRILGYMPQEALGRKCYEVLSGRVPGSLVTACRDGCPSLRSVREHRLPSPVEMEMMCASGQRERVLLVPMVVGGAMGDAPLLVHLFDDAIEWEQLNREIDSVPDELSRGGRARLVAPTRRQGDAVKCTRPQPTRTGSAASRRAWAGRFRHGRGIGHKSAHGPKSH